MITDFYLGAVETRTFGNNGDPIVFLAPTHLDDKGTWQPLNVPREQAFPTRGNVIWFYAPDDAVEGSLWKFSALDSLRTDYPNRFQVVEGSAQHVLEILDLRFIGSEDQVRKAIAGPGLPYWLPASKSAVLRVTNDLFVGPVSVTTDRRRGTISISAEVLQEPLRVIQPVTPQTVRVAGDREVLIAPAGTRFVPKGQQRDWSDDQTVVRRVLKRLKKRTASQHWLSGRTEREIEEFVSLLDLPDGPEASLDLESQRIARARSILKSAQQTERQTKELVDAIGGSHAVLKSVEQETQGLRDQVLAEAHHDAALIRAEATEEAKTIRSDARQLEDAALTLVEHAKDEAKAAAAQVEAEHGFRLAVLRSDAQDLERRIEQLRHEADGHQAVLQGAVAQLNTELDLQLEEMISRPDRFVGELAIFQAAAKYFGRSSLPQVFNGTTAVERQGSSASVSMSRLWMVAPDSPATVETKSFADVSESMSGVSGIHGLGLAAAAWQARGVPIAIGSNGTHALRRLAGSIAGGRFLSIPVSPAWLEPSDLFGRVNEHTREFVPDKHGLLDLLLDTEDTDGLVVVCLEGLNLAPVESYFLPLLAHYHAVGTAGHRGRIAVCHPSEVSANSRYAAAAQLVWPSNVLLAGTLTTGTTTLPIPPDLWNAAVFMPEAILSASQPRATRRTELAEIALDSWREQQKRARRAEGETWDHFIAQANLDLPEASLANSGFWRALFLAVLSITDLDDVALDAVLATTVLPALVSAPHEHEVSPYFSDVSALANVVAQEITRASHPLRLGHT